MNKNYNKIIEYLKKIKKEKSRISLPEISQALNLSVDQVEKVMECLVKEKKIKEV